jgi:hypothetical protein
MNAIQENACPAENVATYLDGELSGRGLEDFEAHLAACRVCASELRTQRQLLCTLEAALSSAPQFKLPHNFTRIVAVHAESDLSGMRNKVERRRALKMCAILALAAFALLGATSRVMVFQPVRGFAQMIARLSELLWQTMYDAGVGVGVILRMIGRAAVTSPYGIGILLTLAFLIAVSLLPRLIANYHRTQIIE